MSDEFLARFEQQREARRQAERSFQIMGETLTVRPSIAPETALNLQTKRIAYYEAIGEIPGLLAVVEAEQAKNGEGDPDAASAAVFAAVNARDVKEEELLAVAEETILSCLTTESHAAWARLRAKEAAEPVSGAEIFDIADYLIERVSGIPTVAPAGSSSGRTKTRGSSKEKSSSQATTPTS